MLDTLTEPFTVLGVQLNGFRSYDHAVETIGQRIKARRPTFCVAINPEKVYRSARDAKLKSALDRADVRICDGIGVAIASLLIERRRLPRCTGIELFMRLVEASAKEGWGIFLLGASEESNAAACRELVAQHPGLKIAGSQHGFFRDPAQVVDKINQSGADLLFVAMGSPRQEFWIAEHMSSLKPSFVYGSRREPRRTQRHGDSCPGAVFEDRHRVALSIARTTQPAPAAACIAVVRAGRSQSDGGSSGASPDESVASAGGVQNSKVLLLREAT